MNWNQFRAILWLRWRLSWNALVRAGTLNAVVAIILLVFLGAGAVASAFGGFALGTFVLANKDGQVLLVVWDGVVMAFLVFWLVGLLTEIQRSESIDLPKLLHLPLGLQQVFVFNYLASHLTPAILLFLPGMLGLSLGLAVGGGVRMVLLLPLVAAFIFMLTAWTYYLRGWLSALMVNKRRRRAILGWITLAVVLMAQVPSAIINSTVTHRHRSRPQAQPGDRPGAGNPGADRVQWLPDSFVDAHVVVPAGWVSYGAMSLQQGLPAPALGAACASCLLGVLGLARSYRATLRFYRGAEDGSKVARRTGPAGARPQGVLLVERTLPWLRDDTAALALATLRGLLRAPELKMALIMPIVTGVVFGSLGWRALKTGVPPRFSGFLAPAAAILAIFSFAPMLGNAFGLDRNGFRGLVLLPTRRDQVLLAKNLAFLPLVGAVGVALLTLGKFMLRAPWTVFLAGLVEIPLVFFLFIWVGNFLSILAPYKLAAGTLQARKPKAIIFVAVAITMVVMPLVLWPAVIPAVLQLACSFVSGMPAWLPINLAASLAGLWAATWLYRLILPAQGRLLQRREQRILAEVTEESE